MFKLLIPTGIILNLVFSSLALATKSQEKSNFLHPHNNGRKVRRNKRVLPKYYDLSTRAKIEEAIKKGVKFPDGMLEDIYSIQKRQEDLAAWALIELSESSSK